jgi:hypothetical protein
MRHALALFFTVLASTAAAHPGHLGEIAGHDHWVAGIALGLAILLGIRGALKGKDASTEEEIEDEDTEEAAA